MERNTEAAAQECFMKISVLKNVRKIHAFNVCGKTLLSSQRLKERRQVFPCELSENLQSNLDLIKPIDNLIIFSCPIYLEWTKASLRKDLPQNTSEQLLLEVATAYKIKSVAREKFNIFIFIFSFCGMKQMKQTFKYSVVIEKENSWKHFPQFLQIF